MDIVKYTAEKMVSLFNSGNVKIIRGWGESTYSDDEYICECELDYYKIHVQFTVSHNSSWWLSISEIKGDYDRFDKIFDFSFKRGTKEYEENKGLCDKIIEMFTNAKKEEKEEREKDLSEIYYFFS